MRAGIVQAAVEQARRRRLAGGGIEDRRGRIERAQARDQRVLGVAPLGRIEQVGLGQHDAVGDRGLLHRLEMLRRASPRR